MSKRVAYYGYSVIREIKKPGAVYVDALLCAGSDPAYVKVVKKDLLSELDRHPTGKLYAFRLGGRCWPTGLFVCRNPNR